MKKLTHAEIDQKLSDAIKALDRPKGCICEIELASDTAAQQWGMDAPTPILSPDYTCPAHFPQTAQALKDRP